MVSQGWDLEPEPGTSIGLPKRPLGLVLRVRRSKVTTSTRLAVLKAPRPSSSIPATRVVVTSSATGDLATQMLGERPAWRGVLVVVVRAARGRAVRGGRLASPDMSPRQRCQRRVQGPANTPTVRVAGHASARPRDERGLRVSRPAMPRGQRMTPRDRGRAGTVP
jgi:hypothetical protein